MDIININTDSICRLCLKTFKSNSKVLDEVILSNLNSLLLYPDVTITDEPTICETCAENIRQSLDFKAKCVFTEDHISTSRCYDHNSCRFCREAVKSGSSVALENDDAEMLHKYLPELNIDLAEQLAVCTLCRGSLRCHFNFVKKCLQIEAEIIEYCIVEGTNDKGQIDLAGVANFTSKNMLKNKHGLCANDIRKTWIESGTNLNTKSEIKEENDIEVHDDGVKLENAGEPKIKMEPDESDSLQDDVLASQQIHNCTQCQYRTKRRSDLKNHMLSHKNISEVTSYNCETCTFKTKYKNCLRKHTLIHKSTDEITMTKCHLCDYRAKRRDSLKLHLLTHKSMSEVCAHACDRCSFQTKYKHCLRNHYYKIHKNGEQIDVHRCHVCDFRTNQLYRLKQHTLSHKSMSEVPTYSCETCGHKTKYKNNLSMHMLRHRSKFEVTVHKCMHCGYQTRFTNNFYKHVLVHKTSDEAAVSANKSPLRVLNEGGRHLRRRVV